jgi:formate-dependent nitrite reductase membrane component NrfD
MSDTFFTKPPDWAWLVIVYFFVGGIAGGSYFIAALLDLFGDPRDRPVARLGYYVALIGAVISAVLLTADLGRPERFWHMLIQSERGWPMLKWWSPMSVGSWGISLFGLFAFLSVLATLEEGGIVRRAGLRKLRTGILGTLIVVLGGLFGFFVAGYTGVLLSVTNRPIWADTHFVGLLFLFSAASSAAAALSLLGQWRGAGTAATVRWLSQVDSGALVLELMALIALVISLGSVARVWLSVWGAVLVVGVVIAGILLPLALHLRPRLLGQLSVPAGAALVLVGGFLLRVVVVLSSEGV